MLHRDCDLGPVRAVSASVSATAEGCEARFRLEGDLSAIVAPDHATPQRADGLWQTTCFEIFWQPIGERSYREFNLSPSSRWAAYRFDDFREGMRDAPIEAISVSCSRGKDSIELSASITADLPVPAQVALTAVVKERSGKKQYWALAFPPGRPEFHSEAGRVMIVDREDQP